MGPAIYGLFLTSFAFGNFFQFFIVLGCRETLGFENILWILFSINIFIFIVNLAVELKYDWKPMTLKFREEQQISKKKLQELEDAKKTLIYIYKES